MTEAVKALRKGGCDRVIGPAKFNANGPVGLLVNGFEHEPYFMEPYNASYYPEFFENYGFTKLDDWYTLRVDDAFGERVRQYIDKAEKLEDIIKQSKTRGRILREATFRQADFKHMEAEVQVLDREYNGNWGKGNHPQFVTMTRPELTKLANDVRLVTRPEYVIIVEHEGKPVGISASAPNINEKILEWDRKDPDYMPSFNFWSLRDLARDVSIFSKILDSKNHNTFESLRVLILGVEEDYRGTGLDGALYSRCFKAAIKNGIRRASLSQLAECNRDIVNPITNIGGDDYIICRVYSRDI
jgi:GNAT superfamily N-acetyltransferase